MGHLATGGCKPTRSLLIKCVPWRKNCPFLFYTKIMCGLEATSEVSFFHSLCSAGQEEASSSLVLPTPACPVSSPQSRMVRNEIPYFIWTTRRDVLDCRFLSKEQMINHYARAGSFTTKVGSPGEWSLQLPTSRPLDQQPSSLLSLLVRESSQDSFGI